MRRRNFCISSAAASFFAAPSLRASVPMSSSNTIQIGQSIALSGPVASQVKTVISGAELVFDRTNRAGGIKGRQVHLISLDDQLAPNKTVENCEKLIKDHGVSALFGLMGSPNLIAAEPLLRRSGIPVIGGFAVSDSARAQTKGVAYYTRAGYGREAGRIVEQVTTLGIRRISIVHFANAGGEEVKKILTEELARKGLSPTTIAAAQIDGSNMQEVVSSIAAGEPQAVVLFVAGTLPAKLIAGLEQRGRFASYYGMSVVPGEPTAKELGGKLRSLAIAQAVPYPWSDSNAAIVEFRKAATAAGVPINYQSYEGYVMAMVLVEALKRSEGKEVTPAGVHTSIQSMKAKLGGMEMDFTENGSSGSKFVELVLVSGEGRFTR